MEMFDNLKDFLSNQFNKPEMKYLLRVDGKAFLKLYLADIFEILNMLNTLVTFLDPA